MRTVKEREDAVHTFCSETSSGDESWIDGSSKFTRNKLVELLEEAYNTGRKDERAHAGAIVERFSTWIDSVCGPINFENYIKKSTLIDAWDRARSPSFFEAHEKKTKNP